MIYTGYYAKVTKYKSINKTLKLISISRTSPYGIKLNGSVPILAPSSDLLSDYKSGLVSQLEYKERYLNQLKRIDLKSIENKLQNCILLCYECSSDFCHRHILAEYLRNNQIKIKEFEC